MKKLSPREQQVLDLLLEGLSKAEIARRLGISRSSVRQHERTIKIKQEAFGDTPPVPEGYMSPLTTVKYKLIDGKYVITDEWRRIMPEFDVLTKFVRELADSVKGMGKAPKRRPRKTDTDNGLGEVDIFDPHIGLLAKAAITRDQDQTTQSAIDNMLNAVEYLAGKFTRPKKIVLVLGGDMMHTDNRSNKTEKSGHVLQTDILYQYLVEYTRSACVDAVSILTQVAEEVEIVITPGNHDWHGCVWLRLVLDAWYRDCPNVSVCMQKAERKVMTWGGVMLVWTHGDGGKAKDWGSIIPAEMPEIWGATKRRYLRCGHLHHKKSLALATYREEHKGIEVEYLEALCRMNIFEAHSGYVGSDRGASAFEYDRTKCRARFYY